VINGGTFGQRWLDLCAYYGVPHDEFPVVFGCTPDYDALSQSILSGAYSLVLMQHHETSSGCLYDLEAISGWCRRSRATFVVDAIGSFLADDFSMKRHHVDIATLSSQKGLNLPPGLSFVMLSPEWASRHDWGAGSYYFDWRLHAENLQRGQTPFSPATPLFIQLHTRLKQLERTGIEPLITSTQNKAVAFRAACITQGWDLVTASPSNALTGVKLPVEARPVVNALGSKGFFVMPSAQPNLIRVAHLGISTVADHIDLVQEIRQCIQKSQA
jgi:aspartate aminotransferase-like enzyme